MGSPVIFNGVYGKLLATGGLRQKNNVLLHSGVGTPEGAITAVIGSMYTNTANGALYTKTAGSGNTGWTLVSGGGGGTVSYPDKNILIVDPNLTADGIKIFNTILAARTYALTQSPSATNPFLIKVSGGQFADGIIVTPYIAYDLQANTRINGAITSSLGFADIASVDYSFISRGILTDLTGTAGAFFHLFDNCAIHSSTVSNAAIYAFNKSVIRNVDLSAPGSTSIMTGGCYVSSGTFRGLSATGATFNNNLGGAGVFIQSGTYIKCSFETVTIQDITATLSFFDCFFSQIPVTWPTFANASINMVGCVSNNELTIGFNGTNPNSWLNNTNIKYSLATGETFPTNENYSDGNVFYYYNQIGYNEVATNAGASLTYTATVKNYIPLNGRIRNIAVALTSSFTGTGITSLLLDIGTTGNNTKFLTGFDLLQAATANSFIDVAVNAIQSIGVSTDVNLTFTAVGANLDQLATGVLEIRLDYTEATV